MIRRFILILLATSLLVFAHPAPAKAQTTPVTVTITRFIELNNPDNETVAFHGDYYARVTIATFSSQESSEVSYDPDFGEGVIFTLPLVFEPFWTFTRNVDPSLGTIPIRIELFDRDPLSDDDEMDLDPAPGNKEINLTLNLSDGSWSGDVPTGQTFSQGDGDDDHAKLFFDISTLSASGDADGDGLLDGWEQRGLDANGDGTIDIDLPGFGANPNHKDLFIELDWMPSNSVNQFAIQQVKAAFAAAPINAGSNASSLSGGVNANPNPDGLPGINLWIDTGTLSDVNAAEDGLGSSTCGDNLDNGGDGTADAADPDCLVGDNLGGGNQIPTSTICNLDSTFYAAKQTNFDANRAWVFRYGLSAQGCDQDMDGNQDSGGWGEIGGNDFIEFNHNGGIVMHEFGHTLNLRHGGNVNANCKPNYVSVMNYDYQNNIRQVGGDVILDYSPPRFTGGRGAAPLPTLAEGNLSENALDPTDNLNRIVYSVFVPGGSENATALNTCNDNIDNDGNGQIDATDPACYTKVQSNLDQTVNWDGIAATTGPYAANIDLSGNANVNVATTPPTAPNFAPAQCASNTATNSTLTGFADWPVISLPFRQFGESASGAINPTTEPEPTLAELQDLEEMLNTTDIGVTLADAPDPAVAGTELVYTIDVENFGLNPASDVRVSNILPPGVTYVSDTGGCVENPAGTLTCDLDEIEAGLTRQFAITVLIDADLVYNAGGPTTLANTVTVENLAGPDSIPTNNLATTETQIVAVADLGIVSFEPLNWPSQVIVGTPVEISLRKVIVNDGPSAPMDVDLTVTATPPADAIVTPATATITAMALALDEERSVDETFTVQCNGYSHHLFTFDNQIAPSRSDDTDPDLSNNQAQLTLDTECVVPVAIEVIPSQITLNGNGVVPVTILANAAGEFGLPLAFDPTTIDPLSVRFGTRDIVWTDTGGAAETHGTMHGNGNNKQRLFHFHANQTGLTPADTEACIKGTWLDSAGNPHTFFGCAQVQVRGSSVQANANAVATTEDGPLSTAHELFVPILQR